MYEARRRLKVACVGAGVSAPVCRRRVSAPGARSLTEATSGMGRSNPTAETIVYLVNEILFPEYITFGDVQLLCLTSKGMMRRFDARREIVHCIASKLRFFPQYGPSKKYTQYWNVKLSTIIKARAMHVSSSWDFFATKNDWHISENSRPKIEWGTGCLRNWSGGYFYRLVECCEACFCYREGECGKNNDIGMRKVPRGMKHVSYHFMCTSCAPL